MPYEKLKKKNSKKKKILSKQTKNEIKKTNYTEIYGSKYLWLYVITNL